MSIIDDFIAQYLREYDFYQEAARLCHQECEIDLEQNGIRAIVSHRAKNPSGLKTKLNERNKKKEYKTFDDIYGDIVDLAGVRIALYFPGDRGEVEKLIASRFVVKEPKVFPESGKKTKHTDVYKKRFTGYHASHYRVQLRESDLSQSQVHYTQARIEIQIASVLMHGWAEVEHDLIYKPLSGIPSEDEHAVLDELNGIVLAAEIALERLQRAMKSRAGIDPFRNHYELAAYLHGVVQSIPTEKAGEPIMGRADILFRFLQLVDLNNPDSIHGFILDLNPERPIAEQVVDKIVAGDEGRYNLYAQAKSEIGSRNPYSFTEKDETPTPQLEALNLFMSRWIAFETLTRRIIQSRSSEFSGIRFNLAADTLVKLGIVPNENRSEFERIRRIRNAIVHGVGVPSGQKIIEATNSLENFLHQLRELISEDELK